MAEIFLIDTNILIYYFNGTIPEGSKFQVHEVFTNSFNISVISKIEFLGWQEFVGDVYSKAVEFLNGANILFLQEDIVAEAINLRRQKRIKLGDAVIAATCKVKEHTLVTRNTKDFEKVEGLKLYNPFDLPELRSE